MKNICPLLIAGFMLTATIGCAPYEEYPRGIVVKTLPSSSNGNRLVRLEVISNNIIHVSATPERRLADVTSLMTVPQDDPVHYNVMQRGDSVILSTDLLKAGVKMTTGEVWFSDLFDQVYLQEQRGGGKSYTPIKQGVTTGYTIRQVFESPDDEAFYGLGQHQAGDFNYKGKNEELFQYNTKVSVPFVVSSRNYGILLDSYSFCRFGNPADYSQLNQLFTLYNKEGVEGSLTGTYVPKRGDTLVRNEDSLYFENQKAVKNLPADFPLKNSRITYEGQLRAKEDGQYRFMLYYAGYVTVYMDDSLMVPKRWRAPWNPNSYKFSLPMKADKPVSLRIEWKPDGNESYIGLRAMAPVDDEEQGKLSLWSEMTPQLDYYFISGRNMDDVVKGYRKLTGEAPLVPKWALGYWQSRERYKTSAELLGVLSEFRRRQIPIDNIVLDWSYWPEAEWGTHNFDRDRFPHPQAMVDSIHDMNAHFMISVWPKFYVGTDNYRELDERAMIYRQSVQDSLRDWIGQGYHYGFYDAYSDEARRIFWRQIYQNLYPLGIDAWWMDATEPNVRDCTDMDYRKALCGPTALGSSTQYFNAYALMNAQAIYEGLQQADSNKRVFQLTRSGFAGLQRYSAATWSGDIASRWEDLKAQIPAGLNFALSGIPYWTTDIGGFSVENRFTKAQRLWNESGEVTADYDEWRELNTRWFQFGAFCPLFRSHGQYPYREPWNIAPAGHPAYESMLYYINLRYSLMPYIYTLAQMVTRKGYTIMRPLVMDFANDPLVRDIGDQYMFGPAFLVAPVYEYGARTRQVYLPAGTGWFDFYTGNFYEGGQTLIVDAPYGRMPLFVRSGSIIPAQLPAQHTCGKPTYDYVVFLYGVNEGDTFTIYEDDGETVSNSHVEIQLNIDHWGDLSYDVNLIGGAETPDTIRMKMVTVNEVRPQPFDVHAHGFTRVNVLKGSSQQKEAEAEDEQP